VQASKNMNNVLSNLKKLCEGKATEICGQFEPSEDARVLLTETTSTALFLQQLIQKELYIDAINFLAHGLPKREAIWWAFLCAEQAEANNQTPIILEGLDNIQKWVYDPMETNRRLCEKIAEPMAFKTATGWAAMAVFWSGGNIADADATVSIEPDPYLCAKAVAGAVMLAAVLSEAEKASFHYQHFLSQGVDIANGGNGKI
jgi:hypothetical protein